VGTVRSQPRKKSELGSAMMYRAGIDENGLGARLGPLVVTAVVAEVTPKGVRALDAWDADAHAKVLGDSKKLVRHGDVRLGEAWARVLTSEAVATPQQLVEMLTHAPINSLTARCPARAKAQCWCEKQDTFLAQGELLADVQRAIQALQAVGIKPTRVVSRLVCTDELNERMRNNENRFLVDLHSMEELIDRLFETLGGQIGVVCGKDGSMGDYTRYFNALSARSPQVVSEAKDVSYYRFGSLGSVKFVRDADATDPLVMLASLVGKYLRELFVSRIGDHFARHVHPLRKPSGYHDPVTSEFVEATADYRSNSKFPSSCFERIGAREP